MNEHPCAGGEERNAVPGEERNVAPGEEPENTPEQGAGGEQLCAYQEILQRVLGELKQNLAVLEQEAGNIAESLGKISAAVADGSLRSGEPGERGRDEEVTGPRTSRRRLWRIK